MRGRTASELERLTFKLKLRYDHWCELPQVERLRPYFQNQPDNPLAMAWRGEPDSHYFCYGGIECLLLRNPNWCWEGYVLVPQYYMAGQPHFREMVCGFAVHGGVTRWKRQEGFVMIGFDTSHVRRRPGFPWKGGPQDFAPDFMPAAMDKFSIRPTKHEVYRTLQYCSDQVCKLADQVLALGIVERAQRIRQPRRWRWERGAPLFPGCSLDRSGRLTLDLAAGIGTADVLALLRDWFVSRHQKTGDVRYVKAARMLAHVLQECYDPEEEDYKASSDLYQTLRGEPPPPSALEAPGDVRPDDAPPPLEKVVDSVAAPRDTAAPRLLP